MPSPRLPLRRQAEAMAQPPEESPGLGPSERRQPTGLLPPFNPPAFTLGGFGQPAKPVGRYNANPAPHTTRNGKEPARNQRESSDKRRERELAEQAVIFQAEADRRD